jgi:hypothetical protein
MQHSTQLFNSSSQRERTPFTRAGDLGKVPKHPKVIYLYLPMEARGGEDVGLEVLLHMFDSGARFLCVQQTVYL